MVYDFFSLFGTPGVLICCVLPFLPIAYCYWLKRKWKILTLRAPKKLFFFGTVAGCCLAVIVLVGFQFDKTLFSPSGFFKRNLNNVSVADSNAFGRKRSYSQMRTAKAQKQSRLEKEIKKIQARYDIANAGVIKPRDAFFLPWLFGLSGVALAYLMPWTTTKLKQKSEQIAKEKTEKQMQIESEAEREKKKTEAGYDDLESAITFFAEKAKRIDALDIDEDEKEMLLMKLQEKKERAMEQYV